jgi:hypothetical protein
MVQLGGIGTASFARFQFRVDQFRNVAPHHHIPDDVATIRTLANQPSRGAVGANLVLVAADLHRQDKVWVVALALKVFGSNKHWGCSAPQTQQPLCVVVALAAFAYLSHVVLASLGVGHALALPRPVVLDLALALVLPRLCHDPHIVSAWTSQPSHRQATLVIVQHVDLVADDRISAKHTPRHVSHPRKA